MTTNTYDEAAAQANAAHHSESHTVAARAVAELRGMSSFDVESLDFAAGEQSWDYVNVGDPYETTLLRETPTDFTRDAGDWFVGCWADVLEAAENEHAKRTGQDRCPYCGDWSWSVDFDAGRCDSCA